MVYTTFMATYTKERKLLGAFCVLPDITFYSQLPDEEVILLVRKHPITQVYWVLNTIFLFGIAFLLPTLVPILFGLQVPLFIQIFSFVAILIYAFLNILSWIYNCGIITSKRIIDIDIQGFINKHITTADIIDMQETNVRSGGLLATYFNYGNIQILTATFEKNIEFYEVPYADRVVRILNDGRETALIEMRKEGGSLVNQILEPRKNS